MTSRGSEKTANSVLKLSAPSDRQFNKHGRQATSTQLTTPKPINKTPQCPHSRACATAGQVPPSSSSPGSSPSPSSRPQSRLSLSKKAAPEAVKPASHVYSMNNRRVLAIHALAPDAVRRPGSREMTGRGMPRRIAAQQPCSAAHGRNHHRRPSASTTHTTPQAASQLGPPFPRHPGSSAAPRRPPCRALPDLPPPRRTANSISSGLVANRR
ncbi:hypothetical protein BDY21DRAFT_58577 [Lineolata rhizophorae]|uniref:Uncharacterized protein n=1 Tax=Lineolata rhizophorae TaxID=578093 RepID=A0A6A6NWW2_9PEZI|nr:hypothetical protein BDY21DRAFT_58577 [Lineolata rhizophorae]